MHRHLVMPIVLASTFGLAACGGTPEPAATSAPTATGSPTPTAAPSTEPTAVETTPETTEAPTTEAPTTEPAPTEATGDCSAAGMTADGASFDTLPEPARATAELVLDAALRCDEQLLATAAEESGTTLSFGDVDPYEFFGLPEDDERVYGVIVTLLTELAHAAEADDSTPARFVWPRVHSGDWADADEAWQEVVDAGLLTDDEAAEMRAAGSGYLGWRLGITGDGDWQFLVAGD